MIDLGTQTCNLDAIFGLLHQRPPDRRMASAPARAPNIGAPHHRSQPHHRDRCRRYRPSATLSRSADSITAVQGKKRGGAAFSLTLSFRPTKNGLKGARSARRSGFPAAADRRRHIRRPVIAVPRDSSRGRAALAPVVAALRWSSCCETATHAHTIIGRGRRSCRRCTTS